MLLTHWYRKTHYHLSNYLSFCYCLIGLFQKNPSRGAEWVFRMYFSEKNPYNLEVFKFATLPLKISKKTSFHSWKFCEIFWHPLVLPWKLQGQKPRTMEIPHSIKSQINGLLTVQYSFIPIFVNFDTLHSWLNKLLQPP